MQLLRPSVQLVKRALAAAPVLLMLAWGIATAVGAVDRDLATGSIYGSDPVPHSPDVGSAGTAPIERAARLPSRQTHDGNLDWDRDVSDLAQLPEPERIVRPDIALALDSGSNPRWIGDPTLENPLRDVTAGEIGRGESLAFLLGRQASGRTRFRWSLAR